MTALAPTRSSAGFGRRIAFAVPAVLFGLLALVAVPPTASAADHTMVFYAAGVPCDDTPQQALACVWVNLIAAAENGDLLGPTPAAVHARKHSLGGRLVAAIDAVQSGDYETAAATLETLALRVEGDLSRGQPWVVGPGAVAVLDAARLAAACIELDASQAGVELSRSALAQQAEEAGIACGGLDVE